MWPKLHRYGCDMLTDLCVFFSSGFFTALSYIHEDNLLRLFCVVKRQNMWPWFLILFLYNRLGFINSNRNALSPWWVCVLLPLVGNPGGISVSSPITFTNRKDFSMLYYQVQASDMTRWFCRFCRSWKARTLLWTLQNLF